MSAVSREERFFSGLPELQPDLAAFAKHYLSLFRDDNLPSLQSFLDTPPFALMPRVMIVDVLNAEDFYIRYFGTAMVELVGRDYTGISASESRAEGVEIHVGVRGWIAGRHPSGYLSKRTIYRRNIPAKLEAVFEALALAVPVATKSDRPCMVNYSSIPHMAEDQSVRAREAVGYRISPICWVDIGAGIPAVPI